MDSTLQILIFIIIGIVLIWFGYNLFFGPKAPFHSGIAAWRRNLKVKGKDIVGEPQVCPVCSMKMITGEQVKTQVFPPVGNSKYRMMYIIGCSYCMENVQKRECPVCGQKLSLKDFLVARMFERPMRKNHIHVLGCNICKKVNTKQSQ
jgi:RNA polymerase subunit RPABC4/transcription elongation factor Spt4